MKLEYDFVVDGTLYPKGSDVPWTWVYPFFLVHMGVFGTVTFVMSYFDVGTFKPPEIKPFAGTISGLFAAFVYMAFYRGAFGRDAVFWLLVNSALGVLGIFASLDLILGVFGKNAADYPWWRHLGAGAMYVMYTFLLRQALLDGLRARVDPVRRIRVEAGFVLGALLFYAVLLALQRD